MRTVHTFILRLLLDSDDQAALCNALRAVSAAEEHTLPDTGRLLRAEAATRALWASVRSLAIPLR